MYKTTFDKNICIVEEPPLTESQQSLRVLTVAMLQGLPSFTTGGATIASERGYHAANYDVAGVDPMDIRQRIASIAGDMLTPQGATLSLGKRDHTLTLFQNTHLSRVTVGFSHGIMSQQRIMPSEHAKGLEKLRNISVDPAADPGDVLVTWNSYAYPTLTSWRGHAAISFWHQEGLPNQYINPLYERTTLAERIELWSSDIVRNTSPNFVSKSEAPLETWGGARIGTTHEVDWSSPRRATEEQALGFLAIVRELVPQDWLQADPTARG